LPAARRQHAEQSVQNKMGGFVQRQRCFYRWDIASPTQEQKYRRPSDGRRIRKNPLYECLPLAGA
jgi:hypothetical protein